MSRSMLHLNGLRAFETVAQCKSFNKAGERLCVTQGAVSQQVAQLERRLGVSLFRRLHHRIELTESGERLFELATEAFDLLERGVSEIGDDKKKQVLRIAVYPTVAIRWLIAAVGAFHKDNPEIDVQLTTALHEVDLEKEQIDLSIRLGMGQWEGLHADHLFEETLIPVCTPEFSTKEQLQNPEDLRRLTLLHSVHRPVDWARWLKEANLNDIDARSGLRFGNSSLAYQAAEDGIGVAMGREIIVGNDIREHRLIYPFDVRIRTNKSYFLVCRAVDKKREDIVAMRNWLIESIQSASVEGEATSRIHSNQEIAELIGERN